MRGRAIYSSTTEIDMGSVFPHHISYSMGADRGMGKRFALVSF